MTEKTFEQELDSAKSGKNNVIKLNLTMNDVPIFLFKKFVSDIKKYNDIYWVKLLDLVRKAECYDYIVTQGYVPDMIEKDELDEIDKEENKEYISTMGGNIPIYKKKVD